MKREIHLSFETHLVIWGLVIAVISVVIRELYMFPKIWDDIFAGIASLGIVAFVFGLSTSRH